MTITCDQLTKRYRATTAVHELSFEVQPGRVTGFLGPNGAGKSTTMRMILGLDTPSSGRALLGRRPYRELRCPLRTVGALLDAGAVHPGRRARDHLAWLAATADLPLRRVTDVLDLTGLSSVAGHRVRGFSRGMRQRLGIATALLGDPQVLLLDEPVNGLDPEGIVWIRTLMRSLAAEGRTVLVSSHLISEMALTADQVIVIGRGRLIADTSLTGFIAAHAPGDVLVRTPHQDHLAGLLTHAGGTVQPETHDSLAVTGLSLETISEIAAQHRISVHELTRRTASLEHAYLAMTQDAVDYHSHAAGRPA
ncbi:MAG: ABC transporter ATP-binding protein [Jatrophihabitantaceae bacterium]